MKTKPAWILATWFGSGFWPVGPGTAGSLLAALPAALLVVHAGWPSWTFAIIALLATPVSMWAAGIVAREYGRKDPGLVVIDEVLGQWLTIAVAAPEYRWFAVGFVLFRLFDIWKPFPIRRLEKLPGGIGIVADDLLAGVYGAAVLWLIQRFF